MAALTVVQGIDVSSYQGKYNWAQWKDRIGFAAAKATEGDAETDPDFGSNWDSMWWLQAGHRLPRFAYSYFHASLNPVVQAAHLIATVRGHGLLAGDNFVADFEATGDDGLNDGVPPHVFAGRAVTFLRKINELAPGHRVLAYMDPAFAAAGHSAGMEPWHLWVADYGVGMPAVPKPWSRWDFWQKSDSPVDFDVFNGDEAQLLAFCRMPAKR